MTPRVDFSLPLLLCTLILGLLFWALILGGAWELEMWLT